MKDNGKRTQADRTAATRQALIAAGRALFAADGFADVPTEAIVRAAGVSRGALYHHFADKTELFAAVFETVEAEVIARIAAGMATAQLADPIAVMRQGARAWLDACIEPEVHRIALVDAPAVLGVGRWREISNRYGLALVQGLLAQAVEAGQIPTQPLAPLAHVLLGALRESALYLAAADDQIQARHDVGEALDAVIRSLGKG